MRSWKCAELGAGHRIESRESSAWWIAPGGEAAAANPTDSRSEVMSEPWAAFCTQYGLVVRPCDCEQLGNATRSGVLS
jgi:hypothetical protein